jgi:nucleoside 2-deoxyribosyltransferase
VGEVVKVYLCGPINGCTDDEANDWRTIVKNKLGADNCIDPMRRDFRGREDDSVKEIVYGDLNDIEEADVVLANCWQTSWGTGMEIFYGFWANKRVIAVLPPQTRVSPWLRFHAEIAFSLDEALELIS